MGLKLKNTPKTIAIWLINLYQLLLSPDHSWLKGKYPYGFCRYYPSCSQYTKQAIERFGLMRGFLLGAKRIVKCNPASQGGIDEVPQS